MKIHYIIFIEVLNPSQLEALDLSEFESPIRKPCPISPEFLTFRGPESLTFGNQKPVDNFFV